MLMTKKSKMIIMVPNSEWLQINFLKNFAWCIEAPFHRTLFSYEGLNHLLKKIRFKIKKSSIAEGTKKELNIIKIYSRGIDPQISVNR